VLVASHQVERLRPLLDGAVRLEGGLVAEIAGAGVSLNDEAGTAAEPALAAAR
jgi:hypothetical protein